MVGGSLLRTLAPGASQLDDRDRTLREELTLLLDTSRNAEPDSAEPARFGLVSEDGPSSAPAENPTHRQYPADFAGPLFPRDSYGPIPAHPPGADVDANMREAARMFPDPWAFRNAVKNKGPWDYKQQGKQYEHFGNFNYGATGHVWGFSDTFLLKKAGEAQIDAGTSRPEWQPGGGSEPPYGDDPEDQKWIQRGIDYAKSHSKVIGVGR